MNRLVRALGAIACGALLTTGATSNAFAAGGSTTSSASARAADHGCLPGAPPTHVGEPRKCLWDGGSAGSGYPDEETCQPVADRYNDQDPDHDYQCEDVFGNGSWWVVRY